LIGAVPITARDSFLVLGVCVPTRALGAVVQQQLAAARADGQLVGAGRAGPAHERRILDGQIDVLRSARREIPKHDLSIAQQDKAAKVSIESADG